MLPTVLTHRNWKVSALLLALAGCRDASAPEAMRSVDFVNYLNAPVVVRFHGRDFGSLAPLERRAVQVPAIADSADVVLGNIFLPDGSLAVNDLKGVTVALGPDDTARISPTTKPDSIYAIIQPRIANTSGVTYSVGFARWVPLPGSSAKCTSSTVGCEEVITCQGSVAGQQTVTLGFFRATFLDILVIYRNPNCTGPGAGLFVAFARNDSDPLSGLYVWNVERPIFNQSPP